MGIDNGLENLDMMSLNGESIDVSHVNDNSSEQCWMLRSLPESSVACVTGDYAMQNVLLQMGLRLLAPGGMQIQELHRFFPAFTSRGQRFHDQEPNFTSRSASTKVSVSKDRKRISRG
ncbi:hypothetical protein ACH5RR_041551 [Cinchona calisaya]|uniref:Uncharacterized protein n=1 Tax=Cinchona calisaya TaxID=153742 RepID=A0ABD2XX72_9GENT